MAESALLAQVHEALTHVNDPEIHRPITDLGMVDGVAESCGVVTVKLLLTIAGCPMKDALRDSVATAVRAVEGVRRVDVEMTAMNEEQRLELRKKLGGQVRDIPFAAPTKTCQVLAIASGKGGVGKSSVTANLALALAARGLAVGVLDADIYGHSLPGILGVPDAHPTGVDGMIMPVPVLGLRVISMGMFKADRRDVVAWRGPILDKALTQMLTDVVWGDLDFLLIDLPPGTGDVAMSLGQKLPGSEVVVVTTPQPAAAEVAERAGTMADLMHQHVLGVVENMSWLETTCAHCGDVERVELFGAGGGAATAAAIGERVGYPVPVLAQVPLEPALRQCGDAGTPIVLADPESPASKAFVALAELLAGRGRGAQG